LNAAISSFASLTTRILENGGTFLWTGAGNINLNSAVITNRTGALFHAQNAATLAFVGGTYTAGGDSSITGAGQFTVSGGTANLAGLVNISGSNTFSGGIANLTGNY